MYSNERERERDAKRHNGGHEVPSDSFPRVFGIAVTGPASSAAVLVENPLSVKTAHATPQPVSARMIATTVVAQQPLLAA